MRVATLRLFWKAAHVLRCSRKASRLENTITAWTHEIIVADFLTTDERGIWSEEAEMTIVFREVGLRILIDLSCKVFTGFRAESIGSHIALLLDWYHGGIWHKEESGNVVRLHV
jgi:hypothetical protein